MKYFQHMNNMVHDPKIQTVIRKHGLVAYALYNVLLEFICSYGDQFAVDTRGGLAVVESLAQTTQTDPKVVRNLLQSFANVSLIDPKAWKCHKIVYIPALRNYTDEYTAKLIRDGNFPSLPKCLSNIPNGLPNVTPNGVSGQGSLPESNVGSDVVSFRSKSDLPYTYTSTTTTTTTGGAGGAIELHVEMDILPWMRKAWTDNPLTHKTRWPKISYPEQFANQERKFGPEEYRSAWLKHITESSDPSPIRFSREVNEMLGPKELKGW